MSWSAHSSEPSPPCLRRTLEDPSSPAAYRGLPEFREDLLVVPRSLMQDGDERIAEGGLRDLIRQADVFGFHLAKLDVRQESSMIVKAVAELVASDSGEDLLGLAEEERVALLRRLVAAPELPLTASVEGVSEASREVLETFEHIRRVHEVFSGTPIESFILGMTH